MSGFILGVVLTLLVIAIVVNWKRILIWYHQQQADAALKKAEAAKGAGDQPALDKALSEKRSADIKVAVLKDPNGPILPTK